MRTVEPSGIFAIASWNAWTRGDTWSGRPKGKISGTSTRSPTTRKIQRRSRFSRELCQDIALLLAAQVRAFDAQDHAQPGRHDPEGRADQDRALRGVLRDLHDPLLDRHELE